jgi:hypothetical protein
VRPLEVVHLLVILAFAFAFLLLFDAVVLVARKTPPAGAEELPRPRGDGAVGFVIVLGERLDDVGDALLAVFIRGGYIPIRFSVFFAELRPVESVSPPAIEPAVCGLRCGLSR